MVISCCALNCSERFVKGGKISFHMFPEKSELRARWICAVRREGWLPNNYSRICSLHFEPSCFMILNGKRYLSHTAVPTLFDYRVPVKKLNVPPKKRMLSSKPIDFSRLMGRFMRPVDDSRKLVDSPRKPVIYDSNGPFDSFSRQVDCSSTPLDGSSKAVDGFKKPVSGFSWPVDSLWGSIISSDSKLGDIESDSNRPADSTTSMVLEQDDLYIESEIVISSETAEMKLDCIQEDIFEEDSLSDSGSDAEAAPIVKSKANDEKPLVEEEEGCSPVNLTVAENGCKPLEDAGRVAGLKPSQQQATDLTKAESSEADNSYEWQSELTESEQDTSYEFQSELTESEQDVAEALLAEGKVPGAKEGPDSCILCGRVARHGVSALQLTGATGVPLRRRLKVLAVGEGLRPPQGSLVCLRCCHVLNYADRIELELALLKRTIAECVCSTHHLLLPLPGECS